MSMERIYKKKWFIMDRRSAFVDHGQSIVNRTARAEEVAKKDSENKKTSDDSHNPNNRPLSRKDIFSNCLR